MKYTIELTEEMLDKDYMDCEGCPIYHALTALGIPVSRVGGNFFYVNKKQYRMSNDLIDLSSELARTMGRSRNHLIGKRFEVEV